MYVWYFGVDLFFYDQINDVWYMLYVIELVVGLIWLFMVFLIDVYIEDEVLNIKGGMDKCMVL